MGGGAIDIDSETELSKRKDLFNLLRVFHFLRIEWGGTILLPQSIYLKENNNFVRFIQGYIYIKESYRGLELSQSFH